MLQHTGEDDGDEVAPLPCHHVGARELAHAIDQKYDALRSKVLWEMLKAGTGTDYALTQKHYHLSPTST
jgi:hypothetical protein